MANEVLFAGGRLDSVAATGAPTELTTAGYFDSAYSDATVWASSNDTMTATFYTDSSNVLAATDVVTGETLYAHFLMRYEGSTNNSTVNNQNFMVFNNSSNQPWLALRTNSTSSSYGLYYNSNTGASPTWTQLGSSLALVRVNTYIMDIKLTLGSPHSAEFSINGSSVISTTFTQASLTALRALVLSGTSTVTTQGSTYYSQIICTRGISTINAKVKTARATGAGTNSAWTGAYTDVNAAIETDATVNTSGTAAQKQSYAMTNITVPSGYTIQTVFQWLRAKNDGAAPTNIKSLLRSGGTDYSTGNLSGIGTSFAAIGARYDTDPATSATWTQTNWDAVEAGFESAT